MINTARLWKEFPASKRPLERTASWKQEQTELLVLIQTCKVFNWAVISSMRVLLLDQPEHCSFFL